MLSLKLNQTTFPNTFQKPYLKIQENESLITQDKENQTTYGKCGQMTQIPDKMQNSD